MQQNFEHHKKFTTNSNFSYMFTSFLTIFVIFYTRGLSSSSIIKRDKHEKKVGSFWVFFMKYGIEKKCPKCTDIIYYSKSCSQKHLYQLIILHLNVLHLPGSSVAWNEPTILTCKGCSNTYEQYVMISKLHHM